MKVCGTEGTSFCALPSVPTYRTAGLRRGSPPKIHERWENLAATLNRSWYASLRGLMRNQRRRWRQCWGALMLVFVSVTATIISAQTVVNAQEAAPQCTAMERLWDGWCVYTYTNDVPDRIVTGYDNIYHASAWQMNNKWYMVVGGWRGEEMQGGHDQVFRLSTSDRYGIARYATDQGGAYQYVGNNWENTASSDCPPPYLDFPLVPCPTEGATVRSFHTVQPDMFSMGWTRPRPVGWDCCDTIFYSHDFRGFFPETDVGMHYAWVHPNGTLQRAGQYGDNNPVLKWHSGSTPNRSVAAVSDARVVYDPATQKFYMVYVEWSGYDADLSIAQSSWTNLDFTVAQQNLLGWESGSAVNPQIVITGDGPYEYYLFYTRYITTSSSVIKMVKSSGGILGPYLEANSKTVLVPPATSTYKIVGTPYVFCNNALQPPQWQMYFSAAANEPNETGEEVVGQKFPYNNQILTAFLRKGCEFNPANPSDPPNTPPTSP
jgi:hypothetical protein